MRRRSALKYCAMLAGTVKGRLFLANWLPEKGTTPADSMAMGAPSDPSRGEETGQNKHYQAGFFRPDEFETVRILAELIFPADEKPGATDARVAEFIDSVVAGAAEFMPELQEKWTKGLAWLDEESKRRCGQPFRLASSHDQAGLLTEMSLPERDPHASHPGFAFYKVLKEMSVEGFYSSRIGLLDVLEYKGLTYLPSFPGCTHPEHQRT
jgi:gluconate 2-dehydrogenase gamma chain